MKICQNCGHENKDDVIFCVKCGEKLPEKTSRKKASKKEKISENAVPKKKSGKKFLILFVVIFVVVIGAIFYKKKMDAKEISNLISEAESYESNNEFSDAHQAYEELYYKTKKIEYKEKSDLMNICNENLKSFEKAENYYKDDDFYNALSNYSEIDEKAVPLYEIADKKASEIFKTIEEKIANTDDVDVLKSHLKNIEDLEILIDNEQYEKKFENLKNKIEEKIEKLENEKLEEEKSEEQETLLKEKEELEKLLEEERQKNSALESELKNNEMPHMGRKKHDTAYMNYYNELVGTTQTITSDIGNVREGPGLDFQIVDVLSLGDSVQIYDIYLDDKGIVWCDIGYGWASYNVMNGSGL